MYPKHKPRQLIVNEQDKLLVEDEVYYTRTQFMGLVAGATDSMSYIKN